MRDDVCSTEKEMEMEPLTSEKWAVELANWDWILWAVVTVAAIVGVLGSYARRYQQGAVEGSLIQYFRDNARNTSISITTLLGVLWTSLGTGAFDGSTLYLTLTSAFMLGFTLDTYANGSKVVAKMKKTARKEGHEAGVAEEVKSDRL